MMKEELILYNQAKETRALANHIVGDLLAVSLRKDKMSSTFLKTLAGEVDDLIARSQALKQNLSQLAIELENSAPNQ
ncbi:MAG: hypothetical protein GVY04_10910 [Cyanobacteria bacterium]|nr:hypothetical protein [Cyanobacteria bacterium GSL.Bin1]